MLIFDHLFKTAGTTFYGAYVPAAFDHGTWRVLSGSPAENALDQSKLAETAAASERLQIVVGHNAGALRRYFPTARFITTVRDPVARAVSAYHHALHHPDAQKVLGTGPGGRNVSLQEFVEADMFATRYWSVCSVHDGQARLLLGVDYKTLDDQGIGRRLSDRYGAVGPTERFDEFMFYLHLREGLPLCLYNNCLVRKERADWPLSDEETARDVNSVDVRLHRVVCRKFAANLQSLTTEEQSRLTRYLRTLHNFRKEIGDNECVGIRLDRASNLWNEARYFYSVFGTFPGVCATAVQDQTLALDSIQFTTGIEGTIADGILTFTASPTQWSYACTRSWPEGAQGVRATVLVESGEVGLATAHAVDSTAFICEASVGPTEHPIAVDLWPSDRPGVLIVRNRASEPTRARILSLHAIHKPSSATSQLEIGHRQTAAS